MSLVMISQQSDARLDYQYNDAHSPNDLSSQFLKLPCAYYNAPAYCAFGSKCHKDHHPFRVAGLAKQECHDFGNGECLKGIYCFRKHTSPQKQFSSDMSSPERILPVRCKFFHDPLQCEYGSKCHKQHDQQILCELAQEECQSNLRDECRRGPHCFLKHSQRQSPPPPHDIFKTQRPVTEAEKELYQAKLQQLNDDYQLSLISYQEQRKKIEIDINSLTMMYQKQKSELLMRFNTKSLTLFQ